MANPLDTIKTILSDNWNSANTDNLTPSFTKVTEIKRLDFNTSQDWIVLQRAIRSQEAAGVGVAAKNVEYHIDVDVRTGPPGTEAHWDKVVTEVERILDSKIINPATGYDILDPDGDAQDLSDKTFAIWRKVISIKLIAYNKTR